MPSHHRAKKPRLPITQSNQNLTAIDGTSSSENSDAPQIPDFHSDYPLITAHSATNIDQDSLLLSVMNLCQKSDFNINQKNESGETALSQAFACNRFDIVEYLLNQPNINPFLDGENGVNSFFDACRLGLESIATLMVDSINRNKSLPSNLRNKIFNTQHPLDDDYLYTPLQIAIVNRYENIALRLITHPNVDINLRDKDGSTALLFALESGQLTVAAALIWHKHINVNLARYETDGRIATIPLIEAIRDGQLPARDFERLAQLNQSWLQQQDSHLLSLVLTYSNQKSERRPSYLSYFDEIITSLISRIRCDENHENLSTSGTVVRTKQSKKVTWGTETFIFFPSASGAASSNSSPTSAISTLSTKC